MANLEIGVGWDNSQLERGISDAEKQLQTLERRREARVRIGADVGDLDRRISEVNTRLGSLRTNLNSAGTAAQNFNRQTANGSNTLTQFSRIAQDAPFGIMGIGNNLTATAEAFANLSRQSGGARAALSAVGQSLLGSGGLLLAISLVTTGLTIMSQKGLTVGDVFDKLTGNFNEARRAAQEFNVEVVKNSQADISTMNAYVGVAQDLSLSMSDRLLAVKKLQDEYPGYFGNLTKEQILNGNVATAVKEVTKALIAKAKAAGLTDRIVKLAEEEEKIQNRINNEIVRQSKLNSLTRKESFEVAKLINQYLRGQIELGNVIQKNGSREIYLASIKADAIIRSNTLLEDEGNLLRANRAEQDRLTGSLEKQTAAQIKLNTEKAKAVKPPNVTPQVQAIDVAITQTGLDGLISLSGMVAKVAKDVVGAEGVISTSLKNIPHYFDTSGQAALEKLQKFNTDMNSIIQNGIVESLAGMADAIGNAFATGSNVISAVGKSLLSTLGSVLSELGKMCITTGLGILAIQTSLKTLNPYVAIAAGAALIALGGAVKGSVKNLGGSMGSSNNASSNNFNTGASYSSPSSRSATSGGGTSFGNSTVVFEIAGTSLIGVLSNTIDSNKRLGGSTGLNI